MMTAFILDKSGLSSSFDFLVSGFEKNKQNKNKKIY
jgi:hypothetical protein